MAKESQTRWQRFKLIFTDFADNTTCHGIGSIGRSRHAIVKICWTLIMLGAVFMMVRQLRLIFIKYRSYPKSTLIEVGNDAKLDFPSITVCNLNSIRLSLLNEMTDDAFNDLKQFVDQDIMPKVNKTKKNKSKRHTRKRRRTPKKHGKKGNRKARDTRAKEPRKRSSVSSDGTPTGRPTESGNAGPHGADDPKTSKKYGNVNPMSRKDGKSSPHSSGRQPRTTQAGGVESQDLLSNWDSNAFLKSIGVPHPRSARQARGEDQQASGEYGNTDPGDSVGTSGSGEYGGITSGSGGYGGSTSGSGDYGGILSGSGGYGGISSGGREESGDGGSGSGEGSTDGFMPDSDYDSYGSEYYYPTYDWNGGSGDDDDYDYQTVGEMDEEFKTRVKLEQLTEKISPYIMKQIGHGKDVFIHKCTFRGRDCSFLNFTDSYTPEYGNCFTFNSNEYWEVGGREKSAKLQRSGSNFGLYLILNIEHFDYMPIKTSGYGVRLVIHEFGTYPFAAEHGISVAAGYETSVGVTMKKISRLGKPYGDCELGHEFTERFYKKYSHQACVATCVHEHILECCNCLLEAGDNLFPKLDDEKTYYYCKENLTTTGTNGLKCVADVRRGLQTGDHRCKCGHPCIERQFMSSISSNQWPEESYETVMMQETCELAKKDKTKEGTCEFLSSLDADDDIREDFVALRIYYKDMNFESILEEPQYPIENFLSDIGGTLGLWAGISVLTGAEMILLIFNVFKFIAGGCCGRKAEVSGDKDFDDVKTPENGGNDCEKPESGQMLEDTV